ERHEHIRRRYMEIPPPYSDELRANYETCGWSENKREQARNRHVVSLDTPPTGDHRRYNVFEREPFYRIEWPLPPDERLCHPDDIWRHGLFFDYPQPIQEKHEMERRYNYEHPWRAAYEECI
ncbi:hypothetical protein LSAT2_017691, partial [Lamellibrachia satsuma]